MATNRDVISGRQIFRCTRSKIKVIDTSGLRDLGLVVGLFWLLGAAVGNLWNFCLV